MRFLYAVLCLLLIAWAAFGAPPKAPPRKAPPVTDSGVRVHAPENQSRKEIWYMNGQPVEVTITWAAPEVAAARPFFQDSSTPATLAQPVERANTSWPDSTVMAHTTMYAPRAGWRGSINCTSYG